MCWKSVYLNSNHLIPLALSKHLVSTSGTHCLVKWFEGFEKKSNTVTHQWEHFYWHTLYLHRNSSSRAALSIVYERVSSRSWADFWILPALRQHNPVKTWMLLIRRTAHSQRYGNQKTTTYWEQILNTSMFLTCPFLNIILTGKVGSNILFCFSLSSQV